MLVGRQSAGILRGVDAGRRSTNKLQKALPFTTKASRARLLAQSELLLARGSSEDALFAALFLVHALVRPCAVVASDIANP